MASDQECIVAIDALAGKGVLPFGEEVWVSTVHNTGSTLFHYGRLVALTPQWLVIDHYQGDQMFRTFFGVANIVAWGLKK